ncbi:chemotaxis protein CheW [Pseudobacteriovorax antillogorgiicola]|uniref:Purine-binding chemotaxis protein CheW n=1 Tax=Pseudobacteriovorax antillogorgiicola TaxID=1513793 RepID=A0A1Y6BLE8_9BACT|nr:chemotaxis protein CheW [Pseudobacteriovorax antillogorgiicola]TCS55348.1 purine-binding chemotaxis protein CheW [Pseudobacteriovorax antillogorgiicola]SMF13798.1 purine-binding chemotaxis protein CheW [Pseudobacteriovorax antillogorgiicola]
MDDFYGSSYGSESNSMFAIRGDLDGGKETQDYADVKQFIGLHIGEEEFLLPIEVMNEIIMVNQLTFVPGAPRFIEGVINLRGTILPAINLRSMMGLKTAPPTSHSRIIIAHFEEIMIGLIVDGITYVISLKPDDVQNQTLPGKGPGTELISGISKRGEKVNGILDIAKIISDTGYVPSAGDAADAAS